MAGCLRKVGADIDLERTVVELAHFAEDGAVSEAVLDLWVAFLGHTSPLYLDVTIRCPLAQRYTTADVNKECNRVANMHTCWA